MNPKSLSLQHKEGSSFTYQLLNESTPLYLKTPLVSIETGPVEDDSHTYVDLDLKGSRLEETIFQVDTKVINYLIENSETLLGKKYSQIQIEENYLESLRRARYLRVRLSTENLKVYDNQALPVNLADYSLTDLLQKGDKLTAILHPGNVRFHKLRSKINWYLQVIKLNKSISDCPLDSESESDSEEEEEEEPQLNGVNHDDLDNY